MSRRDSRPKLALWAAGCAVAALPATGSAAGFFLYEQSAAGVGTAFAGSAAKANDASILFFNPAGLALLDSPQAVLAAHAIDIESEFTDRGSVLPPAGLGALPVGALQDDPGDLAFVPNLYGAIPLNERTVVGIGVNVPFGLSTEYEDLWVGRFQGINSELATININPALAYRVNDMLALGAGVSWQRADAELTNAVLLAPGVEGRAEIDVDDDAWGWNVGALLTLATDTTVGIGYRSKIDYELEGETTVTTLDGTVIPAASGVTVADLTLPDAVFVSLVQGIGARWELLADVSWMQWSRVQEVLAVNPATGVPREALTFGLEDAWRVALGAQFRWSDPWTFRAGLAWDESPVQDEFRTVRLPDEDRVWVALGARWRPSDPLTVDAGYARLFIDDPVIQLTRGQLGAPPSFASTVAGEYDSTTGVYSVQVTYAFR